MNPSCNGAVILSNIALVFNLFYMFHSLIIITLLWLADCIILQWLLQMFCVLITSSIYNCGYLLSEIYVGQSIIKSFESRQPRHCCWILQHYRSTMTCTICSDWTGCKILLQDKEALAAGCWELDAVATGSTGWGVSSPKECYC